MLENLKPQPADKILALGQAYRADPRADKIDLGIGVYKDASGKTPVMRAVKEAERRLVAEQDSKAYTGLLGDPAYTDALRDMILGDAVPGDRVSCAATPGGTGAIRQALELIKMASPGATVWLSAPTWPNHPSIIKYLGMSMAEYRYFDAATRGVDFAGMMADLDQIKSGDVVLLHGCCHNPTGANLTLEQWQAVSDHLNAKGAVPFIDIAYQGFGDGLEADAAGTRLMAANAPQMLIAASCSKNFGIYRERTGMVMAIAPEAGMKTVTQGTLAYLNRQNYSFPPDHGARVVTMILTDPELKADWMAELEAVRLGMLELRKQLADELRKRSNSDRFDFIADHRGMFSRLGATPEQVEKMRVDNGIYMIGDSRINIAGLNAKTIPVLAQAIIDAGV
ncbi:aromatic amino acid transaminase [Oceaniglobus ichthyenteri]|uniref:amino acid aminotransferase n=1 Tax=Oceaniglobus ichthyenteri TaxID=2136177 RepID=UPI000D3C84DB|nr:amino acid aminotransferase [Oceaniglobus ichthyenteri]